MDLSKESRYQHNYGVDSIYGAAKTKLYIEMGGGWSNEVLIHMKEILKIVLIVRSVS